MRPGGIPYAPFVDPPRRAPPLRSSRRRAASADPPDTSAHRRSRAARRSPRRTRARSAGPPGPACLMNWMRATTVDDEMCSSADMSNTTRLPLAPAASTRRSKKGASNADGFRSLALPVHTTFRVPSRCSIRGREVLAADPVQSHRPVVPPRAAMSRTLDASLDRDWRQIEPAIAAVDAFVPPTHAHATPTLRVVCRELLENAIKYGSAAAPVRLRIDCEHPARVVIYVRKRRQRRARSSAAVRRPALDRGHRRPDDRLSPQAPAAVRRGGRGGGSGSCASPTSGPAS